MRCGGKLRHVDAHFRHHGPGYYPANPRQAHPPLDRCPKRAHLFLNPLLELGDPRRQVFPHRQPLFQ
jgi:hypothetical protein